MESSGVGTAVMLAVAALLWLGYLLPSWVKRREYLATERNAVRLQQTLRVMAQTAEVPHAVRAESTAREVATQQRALRLQAQHDEAVARAREAAAARASARQLADTDPLIAAQVAASAAAARLRRTRAVTSLVLLASFITFIAQVGLMVTTGAVVASWLVLGAATAVGGVALWMLGRLAATGRARLARAIAEPIVVEAPRRARVVAPPVEQVTREWTPVPVPKPLYMSKPAPQKPVVVGVDLIEELRAKEEERQRALVAAHAEPEVVPINAKVQSRFANMGIVADVDTSAPDLDAVLRRRRRA
ncbi:hypothetical protein [Diaminobutyricimonas sp. LJ205]|uniref:hypothetical protein n=1 Tax=Diaminobutyricimonas sp. LJ205 TaxID=2683590 RepID=UPI0012F506D8|nr:hypothetical protein [Diaminobutyricimonas sp. LJ205]